MPKNVNDIDYISYEKKIPKRKIFHKKKMSLEQKYVRYSCPISQQYIQAHLSEKK